MNIKSQKDFFSGLLFMAAGAAFAWGATTYKIGHAERMGPGYFPLVLGVLLAILGGIITFKALVVETEDGEKVDGWAWKPLFFIIAANLVFGLMIGGLPSLDIPAMGLIVGIYALTFIASLAGHEFKLKEVAILATVLAVMSYLVFIVLLKLPFPVWPRFITG
ncbi:MAG: tripartite tricarboxylate transporter TctB family protein [Pseudomonadota bacterium]